MFKLSNPGILVFCFALAACAVGPDYRAPETTLPADWTERAFGVARNDTKALARWWRTFDDPTLNTLVTKAIDSNRNLREAVLRVREARFRRGIASGEFYPDVDASGSYNKQSPSENIELGAPGDIGGASFGQDVELFSLGTDASWELDAFGRVRRLVEAADADYQASVADAHDVLVTLLADLTLNYVDYRSFQRRVAIARANARAQAETLEITRARFNEGLVTELDVSQARTNLASTRAAIPRLEARRKQALNRVAVLVGEFPGALQTLLQDSAPVPVAKSGVAFGVPAELIRRRPDIRRAERELAAQTARIGVAEAALYPQFSISGFFGFESGSTGNLFDAASQTYSFGPAFVWNLFDFGRVRNNIRVQDALQRQALARYEQAILTAVADVENALTRYARERERRRSLVEAVRSAERTVAIARSQYAEGLTGFQNVLDAQRSLFAQEDALAASDAAVTSNLVALYRALGGGWQRAQLSGKKGLLLSAR